MSFAASWEGWSAMVDVVKVRRAGWYNGMVVRRGVFTRRLTRFDEIRAGAVRLRRIYITQLFQMVYPV